MYITWFGEFSGRNLHVTVSDVPGLPDSLSKGQYRKFSWILNLIESLVRPKGFIIHNIYWTIPPSTGLGRVKLVTQLYGDSLLVPGDSWKSSSDGSRYWNWSIVHLTTWSKGVTSDRGHLRRFIFVMLWVVFFRKGRRWEDNSRNESVEVVSRTQTGSCPRESSQLARCSVVLWFCKSVNTDGKEQEETNLIKP